MHVLAHRPSCGHRLDHAIRKIVRMRAREAQAAHAGHRPHRAQQIRKVVRTVVVRVHGLTQQCDLRDPVRHRLARLAKHVRERPAALRTPRGRHDAVGAPIVASALHGNPRGHAIEAAGAKVLVMLLEIEVDLRHALAMTRALDQRRQRAIAVRSDHEVHVLRPLEQPGAEALRHASRHPEHRARLHVPLELTDATQHPLLGVIANRARVDENDVCALGPAHLTIAVLREAAEHELGVARVHLAAVRFDVDGGRRLARHESRTDGSRAEYSPQQGLGPDPKANYEPREPANAGGFTGSAMWNWLPFPSVLRTQMRPPWTSTASLQNASPRPELRTRGTSGCLARSNLRKISS